MDEDSEARINPFKNKQGSSPDPLPGLFKTKSTGPRAGFYTISSDSVCSVHGMEGSHPGPAVIAASDTKDHWSLDKHCALPAISCAGSPDSASQ